MGIVKPLLAAAVLGFAVPAAQAQVEVSVQGAPAHGALKPWRDVRGFGRVLDLSKLPVVIDEPGLYAIDRDWRIPRAAADVNPELICITVDGVTLDLHGFGIFADISAPPPSTLITITGGGVEIRNGRLSACCDGAVAVHSTGVGTRLHRLSMFSFETMTFEADSASLTESILSLRQEVRFAGQSNLERNNLFCNRGFQCARLLGDGNKVRGNQIHLFQGGGIAIVGGGNVVADNVIDVSTAVDAGAAIEVGGDNNVVRGNTALLGGVTSAVYVIDGTANTLDGNIAAPPSGTTIPTQPARTGMLFTVDGNYYGNNRMGAEVPFALGGTTQTDWGGNVGY
ncbi:MAG TPA: hypothetical protein VGL98_18800 [Gammaproteobacteria bacterium]